MDELNPTGYAQVLVESINTSGTVRTRQYVYGLDLIAQRRQLTSTTFEARYYAYDGHGSVRQLTDSTGAVTDTYTYDAFGNLISSTGTTPNHYLYAGEQFDEDLNLYYNRARYLDVRSARFWTTDPFEGYPEDPKSIHKYVYSNGSPTTTVDPSGNLALAELGTTIAVFQTIQAIPVPQRPTPQRVEVKRLRYTANPDGLSIRLGARTLNRTPRYPEYRWVQYITTNVPLAGARAHERYEDPQPPDDNKPFYWTDEELPRYRNVGGYDLIFIDHPSRDPQSRPFIYWKAELMLVGVSPAGSTNWTAIIKIEYGFDIRDGEVKLASLRIRDVY